MQSINITAHAYALRASGYTRVQAVVTGAWLEDLRAAADRALEEAGRVLKQNGKLSHTSLGPGYLSSRCFYCWSDSALRLLEDERVIALAEHVMDRPRLWDLSVLSVEGDVHQRDSPAGNWHRDMPPVDTMVVRPHHLWFFICLDATTPENGATWFVPGSHHKVGEHLEPGAKHHEFPSAIRLCGDAGDLLVLNPTAFHGAGANFTNHQRRLINIGLCDAAHEPLFNHWDIAGPAIHAKASERVRAMLDVGAKGDRTWDALPPGWQTA